VNTASACFAAIEALGLPPDASEASLRAAGPRGRALAQDLRDIERWTAGAPPRVGPVRLTRLVAWTDDQATWEGWDGARAERVLVRVPRTPDAPCATSAAGLRMLPQAHGCLVSVAFRETLADALPLRDAPPEGWAAGIVCGVLSALVALHAEGRAHGAIVPDAVVCLRDGRWTLAWLGPSPQADPAEDLRAVGRLAELLGADGTLGADSFSEWPPPSAADAGRLVACGLAERLAELRHQVEGRARAHARDAGLASLIDLADRLRLALPPPRLNVCLRVGGDGRAWLAMSDGVSVRVGVDDPHGPTQLAPAFDGHDVDPLAVRGALRAWSTREAGDEPARRARQAALGASDEDARSLVRWLVAMARLRTDRLLLMREPRTRWPR
jgi:hypothetical protein